MKDFIVCHTRSDSISKVNVENNSVNTLAMNLGEKPIGPHGVCTKDDIIITANSYNNSISIIDKDLKGEIKSFYVGPNPTDVIAFNNRIYISSGEGNNVIVYDFEKERLEYDILTDRWPHNLCILEKENKIVVSNLEDSTLSVIDIKENKVIKNIKAFEYPTEISYSKGKKVIYVCESYLGENKSGYIEVFSTKNFESVGRVMVGRGPMGIDIDNTYLYVTNFSDGTLSIINQNTLELIQTISIGGMPHSVFVAKEGIYISDYNYERIWHIKSIRESSIEEL